MAKELIAENRFDFSGGLNTYFSTDALANNELRDTTNFRVVGSALHRRTGSRRLHQTALASAPILGLVQWDGPSGSQIVAICNGDLFYRNQSSGEYAAFTNIDPGSTDAFSTTELATFSTLRGAAESAPLYLYIASGGKYYQWTGTTLTRLDGSTSSLGQLAPDASLTATYHLRSFTNSLVKPQNLIWSRIGDGTVFKGGLPADGGTAMVSAIETDPITNLKTLGRSLIVATATSMARVAGYSAADIQIDQDTEGLAPDIGIVGSQAAVRVDNVLFFLSRRGPYMASEGGIAPVGVKVQDQFDQYTASTITLSKSVVGLNRGRHEVFYFRPFDSDIGTSALVYNLKQQCWYGPFTYTFTTKCATKYTDPLNNEYILVGCNDGFIRHLDIGTKDDVLYDNSGGSDFVSTALIDPIFFTHPGVVHSLRDSFLEHTMQGGNNCYMQIYNLENSLGSITGFNLTGTENERVTGKQNPYGISGHRFKVFFLCLGTGTWVIKGFVLHAFNMLRY